MVEQADAINIAKDSTVFVYEERSIKEQQNPGRFLGDYVVTSVAEKSISLMPLVPDQKSDARGAIVTGDSWTKPTFPVGHEHRAWHHCIPDEADSARRPRRARIGDTPCHSVVENLYRVLYRADGVRARIGDLSDNRPADHGRGRSGAPAGSDQEWIVRPCSEARHDR